MRTKSPAAAVVIAAALGLLSEPSAAADANLGAALSRADFASRWSGVYLGANAGWGATEAARWQNIENTTLFGDSQPPDSFSERTRGSVVGGAQIGINHQIGAFVAGVEAMFSAADIRGTHLSVAGAADDQFVARVQWLFLATGRLGYAWKNLLVYAKGGYAGASLRLSVTDDIGPSVGTASETKWLSGWTMGLGLEYGLAPNVSFAIEYDRVELPGGRAQLGGGAGSYVWDLAGRGLDIVVAKLSYRLGS